MPASRLNLATEAVRPSLKARLLFAGPPGSGKTTSALEVATVLAEGGRILGIDTERESMLSYAASERNPKGFTFTHLPWRAPFDMKELTDTIIDGARSYPVIVIDSMSHFWNGPGGTLDMVDGRLGGWKGARPVQADLMAAILDSPAHMILCVRSKLAYVQEVDEKTKKHVVRKLGMEIKQDSELDSEVNMFAELDMAHSISITKSRCGDVPVGTTFGPHHARDLGSVYAEWLRSGEPFAPLEEQARIDTIRRSLDPGQKAALWDLWQRRALPNPEMMTASHVAAADRLIAEVTASKTRPRANGTNGAAAKLALAADQARETPGSVVTADLPPVPAA